MAIDKLIIEFYDVFISGKKEIDEENIKESLAQFYKIKLYAIIIILPATIALLFKNYHLNSFKSIIELVNKQDFPTGLLIGTIFLCSLILIYVVWITPSKISKVKFGIERKEEHSQILSRLIGLEGILKINFEDSFIYIQTLIREFKNNSVKNVTEGDATELDKPYTEFVTHFATITGKQPEYLEVIHKEAENSNLGRFLCVISYNAYLRNDQNEINEMIKYFAKFKSASSANTIKRIFTIAGNGVDSEDLKTFFSKHADTTNEILLEYLIINKICSIDTYLFTYDKNNGKNIKDKFFTQADYVIAIPCGTKESGLKNELFFAYPEDSTGRNRIIRTSDTYLIKLMEQDFQFRILKQGIDGEPFTFVEFKRGDNFARIAKMLHFEKDGKIDKARINLVVTRLSNRFTNSDKSLAKSILTWKL